MIWRVTVEASRFRAVASAFVLRGPRSLNGAQREVARPVDVEVQRASAAKRLQVADQLQQLQLDDADGVVGSTWRGVHKCPALPSSPTTM